jgi:hypothetical protein
MRTTWIDWLVAIVLAIILVVGTTPAGATSLQRQAELDHIRVLYVQTSYCAANAARAMLHQGATSPEAIKMFELVSCGKPLFSYLVDRMGWAPKDAGRVILTITDDAFDHVAGR